MKLAAVCIVAVLLMVIAFSLTSNQVPEVTGEQKTAVQSYYEGFRTQNYTMMADSSVLHFDTANRSAYIDSANYSTPIAPGNTVAISSLVRIQPSDVPTNISKGASNVTSALTMVSRSPSMRRPS